MATANSTFLNNLTTTPKPTPTPAPTMTFVDDTFENGNDNNSTAAVAADVDDEGMNLFLLYTCVSFSVLFLYAAFLWWIRRNRPSREHWRGQDIGNRFRRDLLRQQVKQDKLNQCPLLRAKLVTQCLDTQKIQAYDPETRQWTFGDVEQRQDAIVVVPHDVLVLDDVGNNHTSNKTSTLSPSPSPLTPPIESDTDMDVDKETTDDTEKEQHHPNAEDNTCAICFEPFGVGDIVSRSRQQAQIENENENENNNNVTTNTTNTTTCPHFFHDACIRPWLLDKRQDGCPTCRTLWLVVSPSTATLSSSADTAPGNISAAATTTAAATSTTTPPSSSLEESESESV